MGGGYDGNLLTCFVEWGGVVGGNSNSLYQYPGKFGDSQGMNPKAQQKADNRQKTNITTYRQINQNMTISVPINNCISVPVSKYLFAFVELYSSIIEY